ncbi:MAG: hypothetical protein KDG55_15460 [Rhodocyclaceae bacterium]|nr:hypothetical protein [Rhodocyclaceae bacterium]
MEHRMQNGAWSAASSSSATRRHGSSLTLQILLLAGAGVLVALLHESFRLPLKLPGHHGIEWFGILLLARLNSPLRAAGLTVAAGAVLGTSILSAHGLQAAAGITYLLQAAVVDLAFLALGHRMQGAFPLVLLGAASHALAPLVKSMLQIAGSPGFGSLAQGLGYPLSTHVLFGASGAFAAWLCHRLARTTKSKTRR